MLIVCSFERVFLKSIIYFVNVMISDKTDNITLGFLLNPSYQNEIFQKKIRKEPVDKTDLKFYRKRISALSRDMMSGKVENTNVKEAYDEYLKAAIYYFKTVDKSDILQGDYVLDHSQNGKNDSNDLTNFSIYDVNNGLFNIDENKVCHPTLDNFVTREQVKNIEPANHPQTRDVNLKTNDLRYKGLRKRNNKIQTSRHNNIKA
tara:strand:- start:932 stop:1543 length:612 start_codon:yes stop_codon:yes gene_type:complete